MANERTIPDGVTIGDLDTYAEIGRLRDEIKLLNADVERLQNALDTCRELRGYDQAEIERLRTVLLASESIKAGYIDEVERLRALNAKVGAK